MGESPKAGISVYSPELESFSVETPGGRIHIRWDNQASATANTQLAFFAEFLATAGVYESWVESCPLMHAARTTLMILVANIRAAINHVRYVAEQLPDVDRWKTLLNYIVARIITRQPRKRLETGPLLLANCCF